MTIVKPLDVSRFSRHAAAVFKKIMITSITKESGGATTPLVSSPLIRIVYASVNGSGKFTAINNEKPNEKITNAKTGFTRRRTEHECIIVTESTLLNVCY